MLRREKLLGHILRSDSSDPMRQIFFLPVSAQRAQNWLHHTKKHVYEHILRHYDYNESQIVDQRVYEAAVNRQF